MQKLFMNGIEENQKVKIIQKTRDLDLLKGRLSSLNSNKYLKSAKIHYDYEIDVGYKEEDYDYDQDVGYEEEDFKYIRNGCGYLEFVFSSNILKGSSVMIDFNLSITRTTLTISPDYSSIQLMIGLVSKSSIYFGNIDIQKYTKKKTFKLRFYLNFISGFRNSLLYTDPHTNKPLKVPARKWNIKQMVIESDEYESSETSSLF